MSSLIELLLTGNVAAIALGDSRETVRVAIGACDGEYEHGGLVVEKRASVQLTFREDRLTTIAWNLADDSLPFFAESDYDAIDKNTTPYDLLDYCDSSGVSWTVDSALTFDRQLCIRTSERVVLLFDLDPRELQKVIIGNTA